ncbi:unnamed protein product [Spirodela intermedia]|uniref:Uncharacterized protein n=2 Tax=Spirodela intermedia TaxID=51605 RepID=A0A7I8LIF3_SPIIN|nr:unnamed protein product [Spirodela intermedia]CAA6672562.1 unnamed protein product [Spirodela intermedia]CAA7409811.1 unnamed protein product [Spirodela intermedia]
MAVNGKSRRSCKMGFPPCWRCRRRRRRRRRRGIVRWAAEVHLAHDLVPLQCFCCRDVMASSSHEVRVPL